MSDIAPNSPAPISAATRYCAVYGHPIKHSASPAMHNAGMAALGLDWRYIAFDVHPDNLSQAIEGAKAMRFIGINLTVPHKLMAPEMVDLLDKSAKNYSAVNTIRIEGKDLFGNWQPIAMLPAESDMEVRSVGFNTDADAVARAIGEDLHLKLKGLSVLVLGAGGAGRVAAVRCAAEGVQNLFLVNRTKNKADSVARDIKRRFRGVNVSVGYPVMPIDLIINATSLGLKADDPLPITEQEFPFRLARCAYDMIYRPAETPFLRAAKAAGCKTANGIGMLLYQGAQALELWTGKPPPIKVMREALIKNVYGN